MAITINSTPLAINPAYRAINWNATSDSASIKAMRADIYINGAYSSTIDGVQQLGSTDTFDFDIRKIMQAQLVSELRTSITTLAVTDAVTSACSVLLRLYEIVETAGVYTTTWAANGAGTGYEQSATVKVVNMATQHQETLADWTIDDATKKLLTLRTNGCRVPRGVPFQIGFLSSDTDFAVNVIEKDLNLNTLSSTTSPVLSALSYGKGIIELPASLMTDTNTKFLDIKLQKHLVGDRSLTYRFAVADYCDLFPVFIQNHLGDFDHYDFSANKSKNISTTNQRITKPLVTGFASNDAGQIVINSNTTTKTKVQTSELSAVELTFMEEFIKNHSVVYKWDSAGVFLRYVVSSHSTKVEDNDKLINAISLTLETSNEHIVQKGD